MLNVVKFFYLKPIKVEENDNILTVENLKTRLRVEFLSSNINRDFIHVFSLFICLIVIRQNAAL